MSTATTPKPTTKWKRARKEDLLRRKKQYNGKWYTIPTPPGPQRQGYIKRKKAAHQKAVKEAHALAARKTGGQPDDFYDLGKYYRIVTDHLTSEMILFESREWDDFIREMELSHELIAGVPFSCDMHMSSTTGTTTHHSPGMDFIWTNIKNRNLLVKK